MSEDSEYSSDEEDEESMVRVVFRGEIFIVNRKVLLMRVKAVKGTYYYGFYGLLSSGAWQHDINGSDEEDEIRLVLRGETFIEDRDVLLYETETYFYGLLSLEAWQPSSYDDDMRVWNYKKVTHIKNVKLQVHLQLKNRRLCGSRYGSEIISIFDMGTNTIETTMEGHTSKITDIIQLHDGRICSCSYDRTIKLWSIESGHCDFTLIGHTAPASCVIQLTDGRICSGSWDRTIKVWNIHSKVCELSIHSSDMVMCLVQISNGSICSRGNNGTLNVWNLTTGFSELTLCEESKHGAALVAIDTKRICSCSSDNTIRIWNIITGVCERTLEGHTNTVNQMLLLSDGRICSASSDGNLRIWNIKTGECDITIKQSGDIDLAKVIQLHDGRLVASTNADQIYMVGK